jgi:hypothetical protein
VIQVGLVAANAVACARHNDDTDQVVVHGIGPWAIGDAGGTTSPPSRPWRLTQDAGVTGGHSLDHAARSPAPCLPASYWAVCSARMTPHGPSTGGLARPSPVTLSDQSSPETPQNDTSAVHPASGMSRPGLGHAR